MQPLILRIPGSFWDSQIYSGRLYLFGRDAQLLTVRWDRLIASVEVPTNVKVAMLVGFLRGDLLYQRELVALFRDEQVRGLLYRKFEELEAILPAVRCDVSKHLIDSQDSPFPFPHSDSEIYVNNLYVSGPAGLWSAACGPEIDGGVATRPDRMFDGPLLGISASYNTVAAAAGDDGLLEFGIETTWGESPVASRPVHRQPHGGARCEDCNWVYQSVFATSFDGGFLADYDLPKRPTGEFERDRGAEKIQRSFHGFVAGRTVFGNEGYAWGAGDKICCAINGTVSVAKFHPYRTRTRSQRLELIGRFASAQDSVAIIGAAIAPFGVVVEYDTGLVVYASDGSVFRLEGEPVNWRVFPRSKHYANQLHVIYDDCLQVMSFNHDYVVTQDQKMMGTYVKRRGEKSSEDLADLLFA
jgi:hypothetical protein